VGRYTRNVRLGRWLLILMAASALAAPPAYNSARRKLDIIESGRATAGAFYNFSKAEIEAWAAVEIPKIIPEGFRAATVDLGTNTATGHALVDFTRMRHAKGAPKNWFIDRLLAGERPLSVTVDVKSAGGKCTVFLRRVEISGVTATGSVLDFLVKYFFLPLFPDAKIGEPFEMGYRLESIAVRPLAAYVKIDRSPPARPQSAPRRVLGGR
jgi:hypothetical protein